MSCGEILNCATCGEISEFSTSVTHKNLKFLHMTIFSPRIYPWDPWQISGMGQQGKSVQLSAFIFNPYLLCLINQAHLLFFPEKSPFYGYKLVYLISEEKNSTFPQLRGSISLYRQTRRTFNFCCWSSLKLFLSPLNTVLFAKRTQNA